MAWKIITDSKFIVDKPMYIKVGKRRIILVIPKDYGNNQAKEGN